ncbi:hypothetical protein ACFOEK_20775 [Litoribrevibacter euphylliae]|uniref:Uncharacterized protein n=1 Tax=Litoribrevibacter euphylliae TaxID=1834034 RepID=A0ABV7HLI0_9GAMM
MKQTKLISAAFLLLCSMQVSAWVVNGKNTIEKLGINSLQVNIILSNGQGCFLKENHVRYKELVSLLHTLYASGKSGHFRCSETVRDYSPWEPEVKVYELLELTGYK